MTIATGSRSQVAFIAETAFGTTPATPQLVRLPFTSWNVNLSRDEYEDASIQSDSMERYSISGNKHVLGDMDVSYSALNFDPFLESALWGTWTTNVLKVGSTLKSFTMEEAALDIVQYRVYTGMVVDKLALNVPASGLATAKFSFIGKDQSALAAATIDSDTTIGAASATIPFTDNGVSGFFKVGGAAAGYITAIALNVDNGMASNFTCGAALTHGFTRGMLKVSGTVTVLFEDAVAYNLFVAGTSSSLDFKLDNGTNQHEYLIPNVKFTGSTKTISGQGPVTMSMAFKGLYDSTTGSTIVITRV